MKTIDFENSKIIIGQNAKENWDLLDNNENFLWFHLKSFPSCHVIILNENPDETTIQKAAELCKENTKYKSLKNIKINYTPIKNIKKSKEVGSVEFKSNKKVFTIAV